MTGFPFKPGFPHCLPDCRSVYLIVRRFYVRLVACFVLAGGHAGFLQTGDEARRAAGLVGRGLSMNRLGECRAEIRTHHLRAPRRRPLLSIHSKPGNAGWVCRSGSDYGQEVSDVRGSSSPLWKR